MQGHSFITLIENAMIITCLVKRKKRTLSAYKFQNPQRWDTMLDVCGKIVCFQLSAHFSQDDFLVKEYGFMWMGRNRPTLYWSNWKTCMHVHMRQMYELYSSISGIWTSQRVCLSDWACRPLSDDSNPKATSVRWDQLMKYELWPSVKNAVTHMFIQYIDFKQHFLDSKDRQGLH